MKNVEGKPCINRESKSLEITIYLYRCYDEHESARICNTTVYLSYTNMRLDQHRAEFDGAYKTNLPPGLLHSLGTRPRVSGGPGMLGLNPSSDACNPRTTGS